MSVDARNGKVSESAEAGSGSGNATDLGIFANLETFQFGNRVSDQICASDQLV